MLSVKRRRILEDQASKPFFFFLFHLCQQAKRIGRLQEIKAKEQEQYDQMVQTMQEKTEALKQKNFEDRSRREWRMTRGLDPTTGNPLI